MKRKPKEDPLPPMIPATTPEAREQQLIALATNLAEEQLRNGTASSQVITHYLKLGTINAQYEKKMMEKQMMLMDAKVEAIKSTERIEELYKNALDAMRIYSGEKND